MKNTLISAANKASAHLLKNYGKIKSVRTKDPDSYVTNVDIETEKIIIQEIKKKFPTHNIISEERDLEDNKSEYTWYIDPLDGTHNYIHQFPLFGTSIALAKNNKITMGAIKLPYLDEFYFAQKRKGVLLNGKNIHVSSLADAKKAFVVTDLTLRWNAEKKLAMFNKIKGRVYDMRGLGCAVVAFSLVARGSADALLTTHMFPWDMAAGALIVEEAGGKVTDFKGNAWMPKGSNYIASNAKIHDSLVKMLR